LKDKLDVLMRHFKYGEGIKKIARETTFSKNTVREYIREFEEKRAVLIADDSSIDTLFVIDTIVEKPKYNVENRTSSIMKDEYMEKIKEYLSENDYKRQNGLRKQCMNAQNIHEELAKGGYTGSYSSTCIYVRRLKNVSNEAFIKQIYDFGEVCEFDWGDVKLRRDGVIKTYKMAVFTSAKTNFRLAFLYRKEDTQAFVDAHARFFEIVGGVYKTMVYDNMRVAIAKFVGNEKEPTDALKKLSLFYGFNFRFCNIRAGNEKGHVERSVDFVRNRAFSSSYDFDFDSANKHLEQTLIGINKDCLEPEKPSLLPYPGKYESVEIREAFVDKYSVVSFLNNKYSAPDNFVGKYITLKAYVDYVVIITGRQQVAKHKRLYGFNEWSVDIFHYIKTLTRKPGALKGSLALSQLQNDLKNIYDKHFKAVPKEFIKLLELVAEAGQDRVFDKITELENMNIPVTLDNVTAVALRKDEPVDDNIIAITMLSAYSVLNRVGGVSR